MTKKLKNSVYKKLGYTGLDTAQIVNALNILLANYQIHNQKMKNFYWNVHGRHFFDLQQQFRKYSDIAETNINDIAMRIRVFGQQPICRFNEYLKITEIKEVDSEYDGEMMVRETINDFQKLLSFMVNVMDAAIDIGDSVTENMINSFIESLEKNHWELNAWSQ